VLPDGEQPAPAIACVTGAGRAGTSRQSGVSRQLPRIVPLTPEQMPANPPAVTYVKRKAGNRREELHAQ